MALRRLRRVVVRALPDDLARRLAHLLYGEMPALQRLRRRLRYRVIHPATVARFDAGEIRRQTIGEVLAALSAAGVPHLRVPSAREDVESVAVAAEHRPAALAAVRRHLAGAEWAALPYRARRLDLTGPVRPLRSRRLDDESSLRIYRTLQAPNGVVLADPHLGCDLDFWIEIRDDETPRPDGGVFARGTRVAPRPNGMAAYLSAGSWDDAQSAPNRWIAQTSARPILRFAEPVDIVYTWVDGDDPHWRARRARFSDDPGLSEVNESSYHESRFRSHDELRYSLRSVEMYAPWVRRVYIVTDGQVPSWLNQGYDRVQVVDHREIFTDPSVLPVFNSHAIESQLHHIPGLAEHYLYLNDDFFFGRPVGPDAFFHANGIAKFFLSAVTLDVEQRSKRDLPVLSAAKRNRELLEDEFGVLITQKFRHTPQPQLRSVLEEMERRHPDLFAQVAASRFRHPDDYSIPSALVHYFAFMLGRAVPSRIRYGYQDISKPDTQRWLDAAVRRRQYQVFCLNDHHTDTRPFEVQHAMLKNFLERYFPVPSRFEVA